MLKNFGCETHGRYPYSLFTVAVQGMHTN